MHRKLVSSHSINQGATSNAKSIKPREISQQQVKEVFMLELQTRWAVMKKIN